jgi:MmyB-like transcription regulator ligand binding domain
MSKTCNTVPSDHGLRYGASSAHAEADRTSGHGFVRARAAWAINEGARAGCACPRALHLDEAECAHLYDLARTAGPAARMRRRVAPLGVRANVQRLLDAMTEAPALVMNGRADVLAANRLGRALFAPVYAGPARPPNFARFNFLDSRARDFWADWDRAADDIVTLLRAQAGRDPYDKALTDLVGELSTRSEEFRIRCAAHDVRLHRTGTKRFRHPVIGELHLTFEVLDSPLTTV